MLFLPENCSFLGLAFSESLAVAEPLEGPTMQRYRQLAADSGLWLSVGGFQERGPDPEHLYNCHVVINASGRIQASYRKIHLFDNSVPNGPVLMESRWAEAGAAGLAGSLAVRLSRSVWEQHQLRWCLLNRASRYAAKFSLSGPLSRLQVYGGGRAAGGVRQPCGAPGPVCVLRPALPGAVPAADV